MRHIKVLFILIFFHFSAMAQMQSDKTYFVVIGTFKMLDNAIRFTADANHNGFMAQYAICPTLGLYYVYVLETNDHLKAHDLSVKIKEETYLKNTWVYTGKLGYDNNAVTASDTRAARVNETENKLNSKASIENASTDVVSSTRPFYFRVMSKFDDKEIMGSLLLKETGETTYFQSIKSGEIVFLKEPQGRQKSYNIIALIPGYKQTNIIFFYANPPLETGPNNEQIITLTLEKARAPEVIEFNHVHFYEATSSLRPVSQNELNELACLLKENPKCKIVVHVHCSKQDREFLTVSSEASQENTPAKDISLARAETVKAYLVEHGIEPSRVLTKGESILPQQGNNIGRNHDYVEVEVVKNNSGQTL